ncbi:hypothetical protein KRR38_04415 [Novosphingobium sp. G106]|uniref:hypothetical protein n=1 Tax=Novosphingobium sp. G106 TaxID=2849500 RepID=UPI001C2D6901|nr:hypothetical protein [Novosphingobium sp. G106]MBV1686936.1 hypothetical protein [Novosphingobium sp. G106]
MKISSTTTTRFVTSQEPPRKRELSPQKPLADVQPAQSKPMAVAEPRKFVSPQPAQAQVTHSVLKARAAANNDRPTIVSSPQQAHVAYTAAAHINLPS